MLLFSLATLAAAAAVCSAVAMAQDVEIPDAPLQTTLQETRRQVCPGVEHIHRLTADPMNIHILLVDLAEPGVRVRTALSNGTVTGTETVRSMVVRTGAVAGVNGDYWSPFGVEQGLTMADGEIVIAPKHRTAVAVRKDGRAEIGIWTSGWTWNAYAEAADGAQHPIMMMNNDLGENWLALFSARYGRRTPGDRFPDVTEVVLDRYGRVLEVRVGEPGTLVPPGGNVLSSRGTAAEWVSDHIRKGQKVDLHLTSDRSWENLQQAISAGPRILKDGRFFQDPLKLFPEGEEFDLSWKRSHYLLRQPRSAAGVSRDGRKLILITVDGRQPQFSLGIYQKQMAELLQDFGAWDGMDLDSGGSATMVVEGHTVNHPSDGARPDGTGGRERSVANGLLVYYEPDGAPREADRL